MPASTRKVSHATPRDRTPDRMPCTKAMGIVAGGGSIGRAMIGHAIETICDVLPSDRGNAPLCVQRPVSKMGAMEIGSAGSPD